MSRDGLADRAGREVKPAYTARHLCFPLFDLRQGRCQRSLTAFRGQGLIQPVIGV